MGKFKLSEDKLKEVELALERGETIAKCAIDLKVSDKTLQRALRAGRIADKRVGSIQIRQTKVELKPEELSFVNQLEGKIGLLQDENRTLKQQLAIAQKESWNLKMLAEEVRGYIEPIAPPPESWKKLIKGPCEESVVLHLSDGHHDAVILPHRVQDFERHDFNIAMARGETLVDSVLNFTKNRMVGYNFHTLWILAYGDHTNGEIHNADNHSYFGNMMKSCLAIGQFHAQMIHDFAEWFQEIKVLYLSGNHGRRKEVRKKDYHAAHDSWDYLIAEVAKAYCVGLWNVEFLIPDSFSAVVDIEGHKFCCFHGDDVKSWNSIPWYGVERKTRRLTALNAANKEQINYYCMGHFHAMATQAVLKGETLINGSWIGTDAYSFNSLSNYTEPSQLLHGVHKDQGASWRIPIRLRRPEEINGPKRYRVNIT